jgi:L-cystine uptake protein TcyP (sodium:dicarboxylate symporter family)
MEITIYEIALIPLISGLVEVLKQVGVPNKYCALLSICFGVSFGMVYIEPTDMKKGILMGLMLGLSASGLYSGTKSVQETIKHVKHEKDTNEDSKK